MKGIVVAVLSAAVAAACATKPIDTASARDTPAERVYAPELLVPAADRVELVVARDAGATGSACMFAVYLDGQLVSAINNSEKITLHVQPGRHILGTGLNPNGKGLCGFSIERSRRETEVTAELGKPLKYRLATGAYGEISIMPTAF